MNLRAIASQAVKMAQCCTERRAIEGPEITYKVVWHQKLNPVVYMYAGDIEAGKLDLLHSYSGDFFYISFGRISKDYQKKGLYRKLFEAAFRLIPECNRIVSDDRNQHSNPVYSHWTGQQLRPSQTVHITWFGDQLMFKVAPVW